MFFLKTLLKYIELMTNNYKFISMFFALFFLFTFYVLDCNAGDKNDSFTEGYIIKENCDTIYSYVKI